MSRSTFAALLIWSTLRLVTNYEASAIAQWIEVTTTREATVTPATVCLDPPPFPAVGLYETIELGPVHATVTSSQGPLTLPHRSLGAVIQSWGPEIGVGCLEGWGDWFHLRGDPYFHQSAFIIDSRDSAMVPDALTGDSHPAYATVQGGFVWLVGELDGFDLSQLAGGSVTITREGNTTTVRIEAPNFAFAAGDWNRDGRVQADDIFAFLCDWFAGDGDFDRNGAVEVPDIFTFLSAWFEGRP